MHLVSVLLHVAYFMSAKSRPALKLEFIACQKPMQIEGANSELLQDHEVLMVLLTNHLHGGKLKGEVNVSKSPPPPLSLFLSLSLSFSFSFSAAQHQHAHTFFHTHFSSFCNCMITVMSIILAHVGYRFILVIDF